LSGGRPITAGHGPPLKRATAIRGAERAAAPRAGGGWCGRHGIAGVRLPAPNRLHGARL